MNKFEQYFTDINEYKNKELSLSRIDNALSHINFDAKKLGVVIHIAGTNGKGSTANFLSQFLADKNNSVALFTSPHILKINERIKINNIDIEDTAFDKYFDLCFDTIKLFDLTYFESIFFISIKYFLDNRPSITILETGLGGRFDATNTSLINDKISVITKISSDHTDVLGKNIYGIVNEKLGIIREFNKVFLGVNINSINEYVLQKSISKNIVNTTTSDFAKLNYPHPYAENYSLAKNICDYVLNKNMNDTNKLTLPIARIERYKNILFDGSHNVSGILALKKYLTPTPPDYIVLSSTKERDISKIINILKTMTDKIIITSIPNNIRSITADDSKNLTSYKYIEQPIDAINFAIKSGAKNILVVGSFYLVAFCKNHIDEILL